MENQNHNDKPSAIDYASDHRVSVGSQFDWWMVIARIVCIGSAILIGCSIFVDAVGGNSEYMSSPLNGVMLNHPTQVAEAHRILRYSRVSAIVSVICLIIATIHTFRVKRPPFSDRKRVNYKFVCGLVLGGWISFYIWWMLVLQAWNVYPA